MPYDEAYETGFEDMQRRYPETAKIEALTGCSPARPIEEIVRDVVDHERQRVDSPATGGALSNAVRYG